MAYHAYFWVASLERLAFSNATISLKAARKYTNKTGQSLEGSNAHSVRYRGTLKPRKLRVSLQLPQNTQSIHNEKLFRPCPY